MKRDEELLSAYLDGVAELTPEERQRVETNLAELDVNATRGMIEQLRALPPEGNEPDWRALERRIADAVDEATPPWWRRWLVIAPVSALAVAAAALVWLHHAPSRPDNEPKHEPIAQVTPAAPVPPAPVPAPAPAESNEIWLDGKFVDVGDVDPDLLDESDEPASDVADEDALLPPSDLGWVDQLDDHALDKAEHWLERKKS